MTINKQYTKIKYQISYDTKLLFVGINPSPGTYRRGIPFSNNKTFWYLLNQAGIIHEDKLDLQNDKELKKIYIQKFVKVYHLGIIALIDRPTKSVTQLKKSEAIPGSLRILATIKKYKPTVVCFIGKATFKLFKQISDCEYGWQASIDSSKIFVMHYPLHGLASERIKELKIVAKKSSLIKYSPKIAGKRFKKAFF